MTPWTGPRTKIFFICSENGCFNPLTSHESLLTIISVYGIMPIYGKRQILKSTAVAKKCYRINIKGTSNPYEKFKENLNPKPSPGSYLKVTGP